MSRSLVRRNVPKAKVSTNIKPRVIKGKEALKVLGEGLSICGGDSGAGGWGKSRCGLELISLSGLDWEFFIG